VNVVAALAELRPLVVLRRGQHPVPPHRVHQALG
jgi:hypothetical protein